MLRRLLRITLVGSVLLTASGVYSARWPALAHAQDEAPAAVVRSDDFPEITVTVLCPGADDACLCLEQEGVWRLEEDGAPQPILRAAPRQVRPKTETTIFLDLYRGQDAVRSNMGQAIEQLIALSKDPPAFFLERDYFSFATPGESGERTYTLAGLKDDLGLLFNDVTQKNAEDLPYRNLPETPLSLLLLHILEQMPPSDAETRRALVVISDGNDRQTGKLLNTVIDEALAKQIPIHTVYVPTSPGNNDNLKTLAEGTGGSYFATLDQVDWSMLAAPQRVCDLTYRTVNAQAKRVVVTQQHGDPDIGERNVSAGELPVVDVPRPHVEVIGPAQGEALLATTAAGDRDQTPSELTIRWDLAPYTNRRLRSLGYEIPGAAPPIAEELEPPPIEDGGVTLPLHLEKLAPGAYIIRAWVEDELGLRGEAHIPLQIAAPPPPSPTPTPLPTPTLLPPVVSPTPPSLLESTIAWTMTDFPYRRLLLATASIAALLSATAIWLWRRRMAPGGSSRSYSSRLAPEKAKAFLHRINSTVDIGVKQAVKLGDRTLHIPGDLYVDQARSRTRRPDVGALNLEALIKRMLSGDYELELLKGEIWVTTESGDRKKIEKTYQLHNRCEIIFGNPDAKDHEAIHYRYISIDESSEQNGVKDPGDISAQ
jgi:hypothetical protein